nr:GNAT family N-acetyltransferase [uncultured Dyadobacter sp.]
MKNASQSDKELVISILSKAFKTNKSVEYILKDTSDARLRALMEYSFDTCMASGKVMLSDDRQACALISYPDQKKSTLKSTIADIKLILNGVGIGNISKVLDREKKIAANYPKKEIYYLWYIGVLPESQGRGLGGRLLSEIIDDAKSMERPIYLETSTTENLRFYERYGLKVYGHIDFIYRLFLIRND